jgi:type I restriction enzyme, R subunit
MNKKDLNEADIRTKFITPALVGSDGGKWNVMTQLREEVYFTRGRVIVRGKTVKRGEAKKIDYVLSYKPGIPIAVVEAKDNNHAIGAGMQQTIGYAEILAFNWSATFSCGKIRRRPQTPPRSGK